MKIPSDIDVTSRYVPQKATIYVRRKQESISSVTTFIENEWDSLRSNSKLLRGCLKIKTFEESLERFYAPTTNNNRVQWSCVNVHLHTFELGDHPCPIMGPPTTTSWKAHDHQNLSIDDFESRRRKQQRDTISPAIREHILMQAGYSKRELSKAINEARTVRMRRARSQSDSVKAKKPLFSWMSRGTKNVKTVAVEAPITAAPISFIR